MIRTDHPDRDVLLAYLRDELPKAEADTIGMHLGDCETCVDSLEQSPAHRQLGQLLAAAPAADIAADVRAAAPLLDSLKTRQPASAATLGDERVGFLAAPAGPDELGRLGRYRVLAELGAGGMGRVFQAEHPVMERIVALKVISPRLMSDPAAVARFRREVKAAARLQHPNIVAAYDADEAGGVHFLVMEYVDGTTLAELLRRRKRLGVRDAARVIRQAALALQYAHEQGMVHRDLKPSNLMVTQKGTVKIMDLGLARIVDDAAAEPSLTSDHTALGTPDYMAPEQARNAHSADARSDIYSLGATLYHLLAGVVPYPDGSAFERLMVRQTRDPKPLQEVAPDVPSELAQIVAGMMCRDPDGRYQSPAEVAQALLPFARGAAERPKAGPAQAAACAQLAGPAAVQPGHAASGDPATAAPHAATASNDAPSPSSVSSSSDTEEGGIDLAALALEEQAPSPLARPSRATASARSKWWRNPAVLAGAAAAGLLFIVLGVFGLQKILVVLPEGTVVIAVNEPGAEVKVDGRQVEIIGFGSKVTVKLTEGEHTLHVTKDGFETHTESFTITRGRDKLLQVTLQRTPVPKPASPEPREAIGEIKPIDTQVPVWIVALTPDGRRAVASCRDNVFHLWDLQTGQSLRSFEGHTAWVSGVAFSADGRRIVSTSWDHSLRLWDAETGRELRRFDGHTAPVIRVCFSPDGKQILSASWDREPRLWDVETGQELQCLRGHEDGVDAVAFAPNGRQALTGSRDGWLYLWDLKNGNLIRKFGGPAGLVNRVAFLSDGRRALSAHMDNLLQLWDVETGQKIRTFRGHAASADWVEVLPDGRRALSCSADATLRLWNIESGEELYCFQGHSGGVNSAAISRDGQVALSGGDDGTIRLWRLPQVGRSTAPARAPSPADGLQREDIPADRLAAAGGGDAQEAPTELVAVLAEDEGPVWSVAVSQDGRYLVSGGHGGSMRLWDIATGKSIRRFEGHTGTVTSVAISPDGRWAVSGSGEDDEPFDNSARIWDVATGRELHRLDLGRLGVFDVACSHDGSLAMAGVNDCAVHLWDPATGQEKGSLRGEGSGGVLSVAFFPDGRRAVSGCGNTLMRLWDIAAGQQLYCTPWNETEGWVWSVAVSPDNKHVYVGANGAIQEWDVSAVPRKNRSFDTLHDKGKKIGTIAFSPDGKTLASSGDDSQVILWNVTTGKPLRQWKFPHQEKLAEPCIPPGAVNDVAFTPDGRHLVTANTAGTIYVLRLAEPATTASIPANVENTAPDLSKIQPLIHDSFDRPNPGGLNLENASVHAVCANGTYSIQTKTAPCWWGTNYAQVLPANFALRVRGRVTEQPSNGWAIGLSDKNSGMSVGIHIDEKGLVFRPLSWNSPQIDVPDIGPIAHPAIKDAREFNELLIIVRDRQVLLHVNGALLRDAIVLPRPFEQAVTLALACAAVEHIERAEFDELTVWPLGDPPPTAQPTNGSPDEGKSATEVKP